MIWTSAKGPVLEVWWVSATGEQVGRDDLSWISDVLEDLGEPRVRQWRSTAKSVVYPAPPWICIPSLVNSFRHLAAKYFACAPRRMPAPA